MISDRATTRVTHEKTRLHSHMRTQIHAHTHGWMSYFPPQPRSHWSGSFVLWVSGAGLRNEKWSVWTGEQWGSHERWKLKVTVVSLVNHDWESIFWVVLSLVSTLYRTIRSWPYSLLRQRKHTLYHERKDAPEMLGPASKACTLT